MPLSARFDNLDFPGDIIQRSTEEPYGLSVFRIFDDYAICDDAQEGYDVVMKCLTAESNNRECCKQQDVPDVCLDLCDGTVPHPASDFLNGKYDACSKYRGPILESIERCNKAAKYGKWWKTTPPYTGTSLPPPPPSTTTPKPTQMCAKTTRVDMGGDLGEVVVCSDG